MTVHSFAVAGFFVARFPSLPFDTLKALSPGPVGTDVSLGPVNDPGWDCPEADRIWLKQAINHPPIREALFVASPDLEGLLDAWLNDELTPARGQRVDQSLIRYLTRMSSRPTPFGLFAACAVGEWQEKNNVKVAPWSTNRRSTRLDMDYLGALVANLDQRQEVRVGQRYRTNTSLYLAAGRWHYAEARVTPGTGREYHLVAVEATSPLNTVLEAAANGKGYAGLANTLVLAEDVSPEEAEAYLGDLIDAQVLVSDLQPPLTGEDPLSGLVLNLQANEATHAQAAILGKVQDELRAMDASGVGHNPGTYGAISKILEPLQVKADPRHLFQVDQCQNLQDLTLGPKVRDAIEDAVALLRHLTPPGGADQPLAAFKAAFRERYETRAVPLLQALDPEIGVGFNLGWHPGLDTSPLLAGLPFPTQGNLPGRPFSDRDAYLLKGILALKGRQHWELDDKDIAVLSNPNPAPFPDSFYAMASLAAPSEEALDQGAFQFYMGQYAGPSGARLLGRFCQADPVLEEKVQVHLAAEEALRPDVIFAEVVHQPDGRVGNILARPKLRAFEIPYIGVSGVPIDQQIPLQDLWLSLVGNRLVLRSARLGREVLPRLTSAHNFTHGLPAYRFLGHLQDQDGGSGGWHWGSLTSLPFLPRITRGRHVLARARWRIEAVEIQAALKAKGEAASQCFQSLREVFRWPRFVLLEEGDNTLWVDLDSPLRVATLLQSIRNQPLFSLIEAFPGPDQLVAAGPEGRYCHELVIPFEKKRPTTTPTRRSSVQDQQEGTRIFPPGSEWLYLKIYSGEATADRILVETIGPLLLASKECWDRWFFLRFADPSPHLRLRFHGNPERLTGELLPRIHQALAPLLTAGLCWKFQLDTYAPEVERYGGPSGMALAEEWFELDSMNILGILTQSQGDQGAQERWLSGIQGVDGLLNGLGFDMPAKIKIIGETRQALGMEFRAESLLNVQLGKQFRTFRSSLGDCLPSESADNPRAFLGSWASEVNSCLTLIRQSAEQGNLNLPLETLASSFIHMHLNRLFRSSQRAHEFVVADFLGRMYKAKLAKTIMHKT